MATAPRDTPVTESQEDTAIGVGDDSMAGRRRRSRKGRRGSRKSRRGGAFQFTPQDVNTAAPAPPNAPAGPLGGRRRRSRTRKTRHRRRRGGNMFDWVVTEPLVPETLPPRPLGPPPSRSSSLGTPIPPAKIVVPGSASISKPLSSNPYSAPAPSAFYEAYGVGRRRKTRKHKRSRKH